MPAGYVPYRIPHPHKYPFELELAHVAGRDRVRAAEIAGAYGCYLLGDVGGIVRPAPQRAVARALCALTGDTAGYDADHNPCGGTLFAYIAGDVVYYQGEAAHYGDQFYAPYRDYDRPILAVPGNHDGGPAESADEESLAGFIANFCAGRHDPPPGDGPFERGPFERGPFDQPNVYWTLDAPWLRIVGLYTNVPEGGAVEEEQRRWFLEQLARPRDGKHLVVVLHQPVFSADRVHGNSDAMRELVHGPAKRAGCRLVVSGHAHNYQRFAHDGMTYVVNGGGGYFELHDLFPRSAWGQAPYPVVAHTRNHSFAHLTVTPEALVLRAIAVPLPPDPEMVSPPVGAPLVIDEHRISMALD